MDIPNYKSIMLPFLQYIDDSQEHHRKDIADALAAKPFKLTAEQKAELMPKGMPVFGYRCDWAKTVLKKAGLVEIPTRGYSRITDRGLALLDAWNNNPEEIEDAIMRSPAKFYDYVNNRWPVEEKNDNDQTSEESIEDEDDAQILAESVENEDNDQIPEESIEGNYQQIRKELTVELLQKISGNSPAFFEKLVIDLLVKMGYGGSHEDAQAVGRSGDGGIDGIIKADPLGLNVVYIQAKRWEGNVGAPPVRDFVGALDGEGVQEGIFITTSDFNPAAKEFAERSSKRVILINGSELARYMINHNVGVSIEKTYEIKRVDSDYFAEDTENS
ncbi:MAG: restriction endonuclease [Candidatus Poribacteria bacterium]|nr:restriction endonuclease [Candidatus Poribacteria bacterium]